MDKLLYLIETSIKQIKRSPRLSLLIFSCFYLGMILPFYCLSSYRSLEKNLALLQFDAMDKSISANWTSTPITSEKKQGLQRFIGSKAITYKASCPLIVESLNQSSILVYGLDPRSAQKDILLKVGKLFDGTKKECVVGSTIAQKYTSPLNESISFNQMDYKIVGVTESRAYSNNIIIPLEAFEAMAKAGDLLVQYDVVAFFPNQEASQKSETKMLTWLQNEEVTAEPVDVHQSIVNYTQSKEAIDGWIQARMIIGLGGLLFAMGNMMMVLVGKLDEFKKIYGIRLALGMDKKALFASFFFENIIIAFISNLLLFGTMPIFANLLHMESGIIMDPFVITGICLLTLFICSTVSGILMLLVNQQSIIDMIREDV